MRVFVSNSVRHSLLIYCRGKNPRNAAEARERALVFDSLLGGWDWLEEEDRPIRILRTDDGPLTRNERLLARREFEEWAHRDEAFELNNAQRAAILRTADDMVASGQCSLLLCVAVDRLRERFAGVAMTDDDDVPTRVERAPVDSENLRS